MLLEWSIHHLASDIDRQKLREVQVRDTRAGAGKIFTAGYEGISITEFISRLKAASIHTVIDVRAMPISRKKGFSKSAFSKILTEEGIGYEHFPSMGCPKSVRDRYKIDGDWPNYTRDFLAYLDTQEEAIVSLSNTAAEKSCCLVCFEADFTLCHRLYVARAVSTLSGLEVNHLIDRRVIPDRISRLAA